MLLPLASEETVNTGAFQVIIRTFGDFIIPLIPVVIVLSFVISAVMWMTAGSNTSRVGRAKKQFQVTLVSALVIGGYFVIQDLVRKLASGGF